LGMVRGSKRGSLENRRVGGTYSKNTRKNMGGGSYGAWRRNKLNPEGSGQTVGGEGLTLGCKNKGCNGGA